MRSGGGDTSVPSEFADAASLGWRWREIQPCWAAASRAGCPASAFSERDVGPLRDQCARRRDDLEAGGAP